MKNLLVTLLVLSSLASCGKKNSVAAAPAPAAAAPVVVTAPVATTNAITLNDATAVQLGGLIDNSATAFGTGQAANAYETWNDAVKNKPNYSFKYAKPTTSSNCSVKWGFLKVCTSSSVSSNSNVSRTVLVSSVDLTAKRNELKAIINSSSAGSVIASGPVYWVKTTAGVVYTIDTRLPLEANPTGTQKANGEVEYFLGMDQ